MLRMVHHRQRLPLGFEAGDHLPGVHSRFDDLERDPAFHGFGLFGHVDRPHAAFADLLKEFVGADLLSGLFRLRRHTKCGCHHGTAAQKISRLAVRFQKAQHLASQDLVATTSRIEERVQIGLGLLIERFGENRFEIGFDVAHPLTPRKWF